MVPLIARERYGGHPDAGFVEVEVALDPAQHVARSLPSAQLEQRRPLRGDQVAAKLPVLRELAPAVLRDLAAAEHGDADREAPAVELAQPPDRLAARALLLELVEPVERRLRRLQPGDRLVRRPALSPAQLELAQQRREREALADAA